MVKIAIAGCGIGGLAAAGLLAQEGHSVTLFDKFAKPEPVGSGLVIQPVGQVVLDLIGALPAALAKGNRITAMFGDEAQRGKKILDVSYTKAHADNFGLAIHRASLFNALYDVAQNAGVHIVSDTMISGVEGRTFITPKGPTEAFDLLIDATGANSALSPIASKPLPFGALWATVDWPDTDLSTTTLTQRYKRANHMAGVLPIGCLPEDNVQKATFFWSLPCDQHIQWKATDISIWKEEVTKLWPATAPFVDQLKSHDVLTFAHYSHGTLRRPYNGNLIHIGDAAHRASPQLGQGANMALLDAYALAHAIRTHPLNNVGKRYARLRRNHVWLYQFSSWAFTPMYQSNSHVLPFLRDHILAPASQIAPMPLMLSKLVGGDLLSPWA